MWPDRESLRQENWPRVQYDGFDVAEPLLTWCVENIEGRLSNFRFKLADIHAPGHNSNGALQAATFKFPYSNTIFDLVVNSSVLTHLLADAIENYVAETARVLKPGGHFFSTVLLFDDAAAAAIKSGTTVFDFRHEIGPCLAFDRECPEEGIAFREAWYRDLLQRSGFRVAQIERGDWRAAQSYKIVQDYVLAVKL